MGFFSRSSESDQTVTHKNDVLDQYTNTYRAYAPWAFATLDPTATLAAMGKGSNVGSGPDLGVDFKKYLQGLSDDEKKGAQAANDALARIEARQKSGQFLTPQETDFINQSLDKAFEYAHTTGMKDWTLAAQQLAGGRGLRTSDTPVAAPAMAELRNFELGLGSKRAEMGLNATLGFSAQQNQFDQALMEFQKGLQQNAWQTRQSFMFGGGLSGASQVGFTTNTKSRNTYNPSIMDNVMQTTGALDGILDLGKKAAGMAAPFSPGGMSSGVGTMKPGY